MDHAQTLAALKALAQAHRLHAYRALVAAGEGGLAVGELRDIVQVPPATFTAHLNILRAAGLILNQREGRVIRLRADYARMNALLAYLTENCCAGAASCGPGSRGVPACDPTCDPIREDR